jgi:hypothetical protein
VDPSVVHVEAEDEDVATAAQDPVEDAALNDGLGEAHDHDQPLDEVRGPDAARLGEFVQAVGEHPGRDHDEEHAGDGEELREVEADRALVDGPAQDDRERDPDEAADE